MRQAPEYPQDGISTWFLTQGEQQAAAVAQLLVEFIAPAQQTLELAIYDFRLSPLVAAPVVAALQAARERGVQVRIAYDADKSATPLLVAGMDPAPSGTGAFVQTLGVPWRRIGGQKLMHHKYLIRDGGTDQAVVWTGSTNFTDDAWTLQENVIMQLAAPEIARAYQRDFEQLWQRGTIEDTGNFDIGLAMVPYGNSQSYVQTMFSPGRGPSIDYDLAATISKARRRIRICSMLLNSGAFISALGDQLHAGLVPVDGIFDQTQMAEVLVQWQDVPHNHWKIGAVQEIIRDAGLVGKRSTPYHPGTPHDFMHNKTLLVDDTIITGSYNFSHSAEANAENVLMIVSTPLAAAFSDYIDHLLAHYGAIAR